MFRKLFITLLTAFTAIEARAVTIDLPGYDFADIARAAVLTSPGPNAFTSNYLSAEEDITDNYATTYIFADGANASVSLNFGTDVYTGSGFDLSVFFVGGGLQGHAFALSLPDHSGSYPQGIDFDSRTHQHYEHTGFNLADSGYSIFRMDIDLDRFGSLGGRPVGTLALDIGGSSAVPSLVGAYHLQPSAVVPIPLPIVLFGSGLALLGLIGRRHRR